MSTAIRINTDYLQQAQIRHSIAPNKSDKALLKKGGELLEKLRQSDPEIRSQDISSLAGRSWCELLPALAFEKSLLFPRQLAELVSDYIPDERALISSYLNLPHHVDFTDAETLKIYFGKNTQEKEHLDTAIAVARRIYETPHKPIGKEAKYGSIFAMNPEVLARAMELAKEEIVLEIAGASGENGILLAFSEAKRVFVNDIDSAEMETFKRLRAELPGNVRSKLEAIPGSCFEILSKKPELAQKVGLIFCRNLIHFFNTKQLEEFFQLVHKLLKPGGHAIFMANSVYTFGACENLFKDHLNSRSFEVTMCYVADFELGGGLPLAQLYYDVSPCSDDLVTHEISTVYIYERNQHTGGRWQANQEQFQKLSPPLRKVLKEVIKKAKSIISPIKLGSVRIVFNKTGFYSARTMSALFKQHGFDVEQTFVANAKGHLVLQSDFYRHSSQQMGVIVRRPTNQ